MFFRNIMNMKFVSYKLVVRVYEEVTTTFAIMMDFPAIFITSTE